MFLAGPIATGVSLARARVARVVFIMNTVPVAVARASVPSHPGPRLFKEGMASLGWREGENIELIWLSAESDYSTLPALARQAVALKPDVIVGFGRGAHAAAEATKSIPIVMASGARPVYWGIAKSLARPGGNVTGMTLDVGSELNAKRLSFLKQASPGLARVGFVGTPEEFEEASDFSRETQSAARELKLSISFLTLRLHAFERLFDEASRQRMKGLIFADIPDLHLAKHQQRIHALAAKHRSVVLHTVLSAADSGGLMAFGPDVMDNYRRTPSFVDRILKGANPAEIPFEQPSKIDLAINLRAARDIGLAIPTSLITQAARVIQ
jgi:putative ABC transport system substrate-binding protein